MKNRRDKLDALFSKLIRERDDYTCRERGIVCRNSDILLDCAHIFSRRHVATRWHPQNAVSLTRGAHMRFTAEPFLWVAWCKQEFGEDLINELQQVAHKPVKWPKSLREDIYQHYKGELSRLQDLRAQGAVGRLEIEPHECMYQFTDGDKR